MREIKFRAWNAEKNAMRDVAVVEWVPNGELRVLTEAEEDLIDPVLMQSTELKDTAGKEIYEGDVVQVITRSGKSLLPFVVGRLHSFYHDAANIELWLTEGASCEVLDNIYANPALFS